MYGLNNYSLMLSRMKFDSVVSYYEIPKQIRFVDIGIVRSSVQT
jgi:hypothetical protein